MTEQSLISQLNCQMKKIGENLGERFLHAVSEKPYSPEIQSKRQDYKEEFGGAFVVYIAITYIWPLFPLPYNFLMNVLRPKNTTGILLYDLVYIELPVFGAETVSAGLTLIGSLLLAAGLFGNFLNPNVREGKQVARQHAGAIFLFTAYVLGTGSTFFSGPLIPTPIQKILPFLIVPTLGVLAVPLYRYSAKKEKDSIQTHLEDSEKWGSN